MSEIGGENTAAVEPQQDTTQQPPPPHNLTWEEVAAQQAELLHALGVSQLTMAQAVNRPTPTRFRGQIPPKYHGRERTLFGPWIFQVENYLALSGVHDEAAKVAFVISLLEDSPLSWAQALQETPAKEGTIHPMSTFDLFKQALKAAWGEQHSEANATQRLLELKQTGRVSDFAAEFRLLVAQGADRPADSFLIVMFRNALKDTMKRAIAGKEPEGVSFDSYVSWVITLEERLSAARSFPTQPTRPTPKAPTVNPASRPHQSTAPVRDPNAMDVDRAQRTLRKGAFCYVCGSPDHLAHACAKRHRVAATSETAWSGIPRHDLVDALVDALKVLRNSRSSSPTPDDSAGSEPTAAPGRGAEENEEPIAEEEDFA